MQQVILNACSLVFVAVIVVRLVALVYCSGSSGDGPPRLLVCKSTSLFIATLVVVIKILAVFLHSEYVKKLTVNGSNYKGSH